jgi:phosphopantothenate synthetase
MSYHDNHHSSLKNKGISVVNPLHRIENKLKKVQEVLDNISDQSILTANDLKTKIEKVLKE